MSVATIAVAMLSAGSVGLVSACVAGLGRWRATDSVRRRLVVPSPSAPGRPDDRSRVAGRVALVVPDWFARRIEPLDLATPVSTLWVRWLLVVPGAAIAGTVLAGLVPGVAIAAATALMPIVVPIVLRGRRDRRRDAQLPGLLDAIGSSLRAGCSLHQAVLEAGAAAPTPLRHDLGPVVRATQAGSSLGAELDRWAEQSGSAVVQMVVASLVLGLLAGGPQLPAVDGVASTIRDRLAVDQEVRALSSQARASAVVIVLAPIGFAAIAAVADASVLQFLVASPGGAMCLALGVVLDGAGALWMARIMRGAP